jgi:hypothetical protein
LAIDFSGFASYLDISESDKMAHLDEINLDPMYLTAEEKALVDEQLQQPQGQAAVDPPIAKYVEAVNKFPFIATVRSCGGHGHQGHISFRFTREMHEKFIATGIKPLIDKRLCILYWEVGNWLPTKTGLYFRWNAKFSEQNIERFFQEFINWLSENAPQ